MEEILLGVHQLIDFVMRSGDIDSLYRSRRRMQEGIRIHKRIQSGYGSAYQKEVPFVDVTVLEGVSFRVSGRADGVLEDPHNPMIDEIKSTGRRLEDLEEDDHPLHWAQVMCYGYFYCKERQRKEIRLQLTYVNTEDEETSKTFLRKVSFAQLREFYEDLLSQYLDFSKARLAWRRKRDACLETLAFPYGSFRPGQRQMAVGVFQAIEEGKKLFVQAPTGIGKTISALYPALCSIPRQRLDIVYYLTARTSTQREVTKALKQMDEEGLALKSVILTAKEKICLNDKVRCNPEECPYAKGHFDRVNEAIFTAFQEEDRLDRVTITEFSERFRMCPHEFQLDMANYADLVCCDYNYFFDPAVSRRRAEEEDEKKLVILVDEAHNLVDRGRDMYSAELNSGSFDTLLSIFEGTEYGAVQKDLKKALRIMDDFFLAHGDRPATATQDHPSDLVDLCQKLTQDLDPFLTRETDHPDYEQVRSFFFELVRFCRIDEFWMEGFTQLLYQTGGKLLWRIQCLDSSHLMKAILERARAATFFSATMTPLSYYVRLLGGEKESWTMDLPSPFPADHLQVRILPLSVRYGDRARNMTRLLDALEMFRKQNPGNAMIFFPSYSYLDQCYRAYLSRLPKGAAPPLKQEMGGSEDEKRQLLAAYEEEEGVLGFFVLGGLFAEGIDLQGKALTACMVVSVGLPGLSFERNVTKDYYRSQGWDGFAMAYTYPGMNKVLQAAGRLIRGPEDHGSLLLVDDRFQRPLYRRLMPTYWDPRNFSEIPTVEIQEEKEPPERLCQDPPSSEEGKP